MSKPPRFDHQVLAAAWGGRLPKVLTRESRVRLLGEFADAVLTRREPSREALLFLAGAIRAYLAKGGSLERDYLRVGAKAGSHRTPAALWAAQQHEPPPEESRDHGWGDKLDSSSSKSEQEP